MNGLKFDSTVDDSTCDLTQSSCTTKRVSFSAVKVVEYDNNMDDNISLSSIKSYSYDVDIYEKYRQPQRFAPLSLLENRFAVSGILPQKPDKSTKKTKARRLKEMPRLGVKKAQNFVRWVVFHQ